MKSWSLIFFLLSVIFCLVSAEQGCPDSEVILPCVCTNSLHTLLECKNITEVEVLRNVFINSARYRYKEVHIEYSTLPYLPHDVFDSVPVSEVWLTNVKLLTPFDSPPEALDDLRTLYIENTFVLRGILWELLKPLKSLKVLKVNYNPIRTIGKDFSKYAPKELEEISFFATKTKTIQAGVFDEFTKLDKLTVEISKLKELRRDILPVPFNGSVLYFNTNKISNIPDDMFTQMPNLEILGLRQNQISTLPESAFEGTASKLLFLMLDDNPIKCDCRILWLIRKQPPPMGGKCESPKNLHGRELKDLSPSDLNC